MKFVSTVLLVNILISTYVNCQGTTSSSSMQLESSSTHSFAATTSDDQNLDLKCNKSVTHINTNFTTNRVILDETTSAGTVLAYASTTSASSIFNFAPTQPSPNNGLVGRISGTVSQLVDFIHDDEAYSAKSNTTKGRFNGQVLSIFSGLQKLSNTKLYSVFWTRKHWQ